MSTVMCRRASSATAAVAVGHQNDRLLRVIDDVGGEIRLIVRDERDTIDTRDVGGGDDGELIPRDRRVEADLADPAARDGAPDRDAVEHTGRRDVVDVQRLAGDLRSTFLAARRSADVRDFHWSDLSAARLPCALNLAGLKPCATTKATGCSAGLPPSLKLRRTAVALAEAGQACLAVRCG